MIEPTYQQGYAQGVADAARVCAEIKEASPAGLALVAGICEQKIRALSSPPSVTEEWVSKRIEDAYDKTRGNNEGDALAEDAVLATLAALNIEVTK